MSSHSSTLEMFLQYGLYLRNWSHRTARMYRYALRTLPSVLTKASLEAWIVTMRERHDSPGGINVRIRAANSYLSWLRAEGHLEEPLKLRLRGLAPRAVAELEALVTSADSEQVRLQAANNLIDRSVGRATERIQVAAAITVKRPW